MLDLNGEHSAMKNLLLTDLVLELLRLGSLPDWSQNLLHKFFQNPLLESNELSGTYIASVQPGKGPVGISDNGGFSKWQKAGVSN